MTTTPDRTILSPNRYIGWGNVRPVMVVIHSTRSGVSQPSWTDASEMQATINWFMKPHSQSSAHWVISSTEKVRMVEDKDRSWHAKEFSHVAYGIELTQPLPSTPYTEGHYANLAEVCRDYVAMGVPVRHVGRTSQLVAQGFTGHEETAQGVRDGKSDPGPPFDWDKFLRMLAPPQEEEMFRLIRSPGGFVYVQTGGMIQYVPDMARVQPLIAAGDLLSSAGDFTIVTKDQEYVNALSLGPEVGKPFPAAGGGHTQHTVTVTAT